MAFGLLSTGFAPKTQEIIEGEIDVLLRAAFGDSIKLGDKDVLGQIKTIFAEREASLWELMEDVNSSQDPDAATGAQLDALSALTGTTREIETNSTVLAWLTGTPTTVVPIGSIASVTGTGVQFDTDAEATIAAGVAWTPTTAYIVGDEVTNSGNMYFATIAGTSAGSGGPSLEVDAEVDGTVTWQFMGNGTGFVETAFSSVNTGPEIASATDLNVIDTPVSGWDSVKNRLDAKLGNNIETDPVLRSRREDELAAQGTSPIDPVRSALLDVPGVTSVTLFVNNTDNPVVFDGVAVPGHAIEALILGGADQDIFDALLANVGGGIQTFGSTSGTATDSEGNAIPHAFTRPTSITIFVDVLYTVDSTVFPADGNAQVEAAILAFGNLFVTGKGVHDTAMSAQVFTIPGVIDVTSSLVGIVDPPLFGVVAVNRRELAVFDSSRIEGIATPATP